MTMVRVGSSLFAGISPTVIPAVYAPLAVRQVLELAAEYLEVHGHLKRAFGEPEGRAACAVGAITAVVTGYRVGAHPLADAAVKALSEWLPTLPPSTDGRDDHEEHVAAWNDAESRTPVEVVAGLRAAALGVAA